MQITFNPAKNAANIDKHGISLSEAARLDWETALIWSDDRVEYDEPRQCALGTIGDRLYYVAFVERDDSTRIISLRKANLREVKYYDEQA